MSSRHRAHQPPSGGSAPTNQTYQALAALRDGLRGSKITERRSASKELLERLQDPSTLRRLEKEAERGFNYSYLRARGRDGRSDAHVALPWERVCILYRSLMDAALLAARTQVEGGTGDGTRKRSRANQTGHIRKSVKFTADDVLFPCKVFMRMDMDQTLESHDGGYGGAALSWEKDWKTRPRYDHHIDVGGPQRGRFNATHYTPHAFTDRDRGTRLSAKEVIACVEYCIDRLNDEDSCNLAETQLLQWLYHICSRPEYVALLPVQVQVTHILNEVAVRLNKAFVEGGVEERGIFARTPPRGTRGTQAVSQEALLACAKTLSALVYNLTTRLGTGMHLYIRSIVELVAFWSEDAWRMQSEGAFASSSNPLNQKVQLSAKNPMTKMVEDGQISASSVRRRLRTEADIMALLPYLYSSVTHLLAAHPEQSVPILSDHGHALLRLARRNYARPSTSNQNRDALTEYIGAHLLVAETSGKLHGLPEGDVGPMVPKEEVEEEDEEMEGAENDDDEAPRKKKKDKPKKKRKGATLDAKSVAKLLDMVRNEKVWESVFPTSGSGHLQDAKKKRSRRSLGRKRGRGGGGDITLAEGGATWTPLSRRQRRHLEIAARLLRIAQRLYLAEAEDQGDGTVDSLESIIDRAEQKMQSSGIEQGEIDILPKNGSDQLALSGDAESGGCAAAPSALACSPWIRFVCRHLYKLNPKLGKLGDSSSEMDASFTQGTQLLTQLHQSGSSEELVVNEGGESSCERILLESCPMLRALAVDESTLSVEANPMTQGLTLTQGTLATTFTQSTTAQSNKNAALDPLRPTTTATLQLLSSCIEAFPRGECWSSSARKYWSTVLDETTYPAGTAARVLERHGSSPTDAATVVYLLGTTLECHGGSQGDDDVQLWTIISLLKMTESSATICSREGLNAEDGADGSPSFGSSASLGALRLAWQYVWKTLLRYDLRYSSYTSGAFCNNVGEMVVQLLTQIVRWKCVDRSCLFACHPKSGSLTGGGSGGSLGYFTGATSSSTSEVSSSPFVHEEQGRLWKLPVFEDATAVHSHAPFELMANVLQRAGFSDSSEGSAATSMQMTSSVKDRKYFVLYCLRYIELCYVESTSVSNTRRTFLPFAASALALLISNGTVGTALASPFELDGLARFSTTEDVDPVTICAQSNRDNLDVKRRRGINSAFADLWAGSTAASSCDDHAPRDVDNAGLSQRIVEGRGAFLNRFCNAEYERKRLRGYSNSQCDSAASSFCDSPLGSSLGGMAYEKAKAILDDLLFQLKYDGSNDVASNEDETDDTAANQRSKSDKSLLLPHLASCISIVTSVLLSQNSTTEQISQNVTEVFASTLAPALDLIVEHLPHLKGNHSDLIATFGHLHGIVRSLTFVASFGGGGAAIPSAFSNYAKSLFDVCKKLLKEYRNETCTMESADQAAAASHSRIGFDSDSEEDYPQQRQRGQHQGSASRPPSNFSDDSDGLMDDDDDDETGGRPPRQQRPPAPKRRRVGNAGPRARARAASNPLTQGSNNRAIEKKTLDSKCAWACASLMLVLQPSFKCLEFISAHLVWLEDYNGHPGYGTASKTPDPFGALVCAALFAQKSVLLRRDRLDLLRAGGRNEQDEDEDQESALILSLEVILQARRYFQSPASRHFVCGLGLLADVVKIGDGESCGPIGADESKLVLEVLNPEALGKESEDYHLLRQWKRILKYRSPSYRPHQVRVATLAFLSGKKPLKKVFEDNSTLWFQFILPSFRHIDEGVRASACDCLAAALGEYQDAQEGIIRDALKSAIPRIGNEKRFSEWMKGLCDVKLQDELTALEELALKDAELSIQYNAIECIGLIAGSTNDLTQSRQMIWKLVNLASQLPSMLLPCYRACKRAALLLGLTSVSKLFEGMMPYLLVKWLESGRSLRDFPLLLMSPFAVEQVGRSLPVEVMSMLLSDGGWSDDFFRMDEMGGEGHTLNERVLTPFVESVARFLVPNILLSAPDDDLKDVDEDRIDTTAYLTQCVLILTGAESDESIAKVLSNHIPDLYGYVAVLQELRDNPDATDQCANAFKLLKRCISSVIIERVGAKGAFKVLRQILLLHQRGVTVVGQHDLELKPSNFIDGMKYVANQLKGSSKQKHAGFFEQLGSSLTESFVLVKYWLSSSITAGQRRESWDTMELLCQILAENIRQGRVESGELGFCLHSFIVVILDPYNRKICPMALDSLKAVLGVLFSKHTKAAVIDGAISVLRKLILALLQTHQRALQRLSIACDKTLCCMEYEQKASQGLLSASEESQKSWDSLGEAPWVSAPERDGVLKKLITSKSKIGDEEHVSSKTMLAAYKCLEIIAKSGKMHMEDILGAEDILLQGNQKEAVFRAVNEHYSMSSFFNSIQQKTGTTKDGIDFGAECEHFIGIMSEHPVSADEFDSSTSNASHAVLARLLALRRLERALLSQHNTDAISNESCGSIYPLLLSICHSRDPEESRVISSRCLGALPIAAQEQRNLTSDEAEDSFNDPISSIKRNILTMLGQYLLSECAETSLIAMKTAKALLVTPMGKECWESLEGDIKGLLSPFNTVDDNKLRREAVKVSDSCLDRLKAISGSSESESWCWHGGLWTCIDSEDSACDLWIRRITSAIISCCYGKGSRVNRGDQDFFRICQGLCAKEASFAASTFPALIYHLLDSEARDQCKDDSGVRDIILSNTAIGSPNSGMNKVISHSFARILSPGSKVVVAPKAITVILNTLELLRFITEHRFLTSPDHMKNKSSEGQSSTATKKKRARKPPASASGALATSPNWRGFPYGVVLRVSGLHVAKACFQVKRYYSALYYAEMSMNNLIGSGTFFADVANESSLKHSDTAVCDISGFGVPSSMVGTEGGKALLEQALLAQDVIGQCLSELHAKDELQGVESQGSALDLMRNITSLNTLEGYRRDETLPMLLDLDNGFQTSAKSSSASGTGAHQAYSTVASCLEDLGLNHVKHNYLTGVGTGPNTDGDRRYLREKWFEDSLNKTFQWDDSLLPRMNDGELLASTEAPRIPAMALDAPFSPQSATSFYESVHEALQSFAKCDSASALSHVLQARQSVLRDMENLAGSEAQSTGMATHLSKLTVLGQCEQVASTLEGKSTLKFLLDQWGFPEGSESGTLSSLLSNDGSTFDARDQSTSIDGGLFGSIRTEFSVKELALKVLTSKFPLAQEGASIATALTSHIYKSCTLYRELGHPDAAKVSLSSLRSLTQVLQHSGNVSSSSKLPVMLRLEDAKVMKSQNDLDGAIMHCRMIANYLDTGRDDFGDIEQDQIRAESLLFGGLWMAQHNVDASETILSSFEKAAGLAIQIHQKAPSNASVHRASTANFKLGEFAANLYNSVEARISSEAWKRRITVAKERKKELGVVTAQMKKLEKKSRSQRDEATMDARILHSTLSKEVTMDDLELSSTEKSIQRYLHLAIESYCSALKLCPTTMTANVSKHVFKLVSLWFKNCQRKETKDIVNGSLKSNLSQIPSFRLVPLTYQLFSRIDEMQDDDAKGNGFQSTLRDVVIKICSEHPYHGIVQLLALSNGKRVGGGVNGRHADAYLENIGSSKVDAVNDILQELPKVAPKYVSALIESYQTLMNSYMNVAELDTTNLQKRQTKGLTFKQQKLDLDACLTGGRRGKKDVSATNMPAIITKPPPIRPDGEYGGGTEDPIGTERVVGFESTFDLTDTGLHRPKIVKCIGSKGSTFKQLVKGEDDMRQDAIMEQVFGTVNDLLRHEGSSGNALVKSRATTRQLRLVTYGITPLSPTTGVLEWVDNTMCFGDFLQDKGTKKVGAHSKYYPGEWGSSDVREFYKAAGDARNATKESKRKAFLTICDNFSPAFRFFFLEYFKSSMEAWHTARTLYTRSCAVNSIVGHILGIGDRHTSNILVHTKTGEVVHIDFGIVFEQGKALTTPEVVPFRLTRDIVDGMGPSGTDGVFSKAAEATMGVLRNNADTLLTILSAVVSDPLYKWNLSPLKANQRDKSDDEDGENESKAGLPSTWMASASDENRNDAADRAIAKIHEKLEGYEDGTSGEHKTVAGQVKLLINEARDPGNLGVMFSGWAPWM